MTIQIFFRNAKFVSAHDDPDSVSISIIDQRYFEAVNGDKLKNVIDLIIQLPRQLQINSTEAQVAMAANKASNGVKTFVLSNLLLSFFFSASLS